MYNSECVGHTLLLDFRHCDRPCWDELKKESSAITKKKKNLDNFFFFFCRKLRNGPCRAVSSGLGTIADHGEAIPHWAMASTLPRRSTLTFLTLKTPRQAMYGRGFAMR